jgi:UDP-GlcNAc:undecaprenyl-phosphate GlcNAc-1-phosphate transferase
MLLSMPSSLVTVPLAAFFASASNELLHGFRAPLVAGAIALGITWVLTPLVRKMAFKYGAVDDPTRDDRRIHKEPLPRWGGIAIYVGILAAVLCVLPFAYPGSQPFPPFLIGMMLLAGVLVAFGAGDDLKDFSARFQLLFLLGAGTLIQFIGTDSGRVQIQSLGIPLSSPPTAIGLGLLAVPITAFYIFVITKTMDTIDGVDGLASGIAAISSGALVIIAVYSSQPRSAIIAAAIGGAALGFLKHNYNPAKIIMGTGGAYVLGFLLACVSIIAGLKTATAFAFLIPVMVFGVPIFDAFFVITRRLMSGQPIYQADKRHLHHTLLRSGLSQRQTVWVLYAAAFVLCLVLIAVMRRYGHPS